MQSTGWHQQEEEEEEEWYEISSWSKIETFGTPSNQTEYNDFCRRRDKIVSKFYDCYKSGLLTLKRPAAMLMHDCTKEKPFTKRQQLKRLLQRHQVATPNSLPWRPTSTHTIWSRPSTPDEEHPSGCWLVRTDSWYDGSRISTACKPADNKWERRPPSNLRIDLNRAINVVDNIDHGARSLSAVGLLEADDGGYEMIYTIQVHIFTNSATMCRYSSILYRNMTNSQSWGNCPPEPWPQRQNTGCSTASRTFIDAGMWVAVQQWSASDTVIFRALPGDRLTAVTGVTPSSVSFR